jgi:phospholipase C
METLQNISHIVIVMMENRSFDHMLGYLRKDKGRTDIKGLTGTESNEYNGQSYAPMPLNSTVFKPDNEKSDPGHDWEDVAEQLNGGNGGFIKNFAHKFPNNGEPEKVIGYHNDKQLPVYDFFAENFCVCDHWFSSVPGPTQPNRFYAMCGTSEGQRNNRDTNVLNPIPVWSDFEGLTVFDHLPDGLNWKYYSHDIAFLRLHPKFTIDLGPIDKIGSFYRAARSGELPNVCWIDPDFGIIPWPINRTPSNDDHPPHDIRHGQRLISSVYNALRNGPKWDKTLLVVTYDEHGGFFDHVHPDPAQYRVEDDYVAFRRYGVRVPTMVISPWVKKGLVAKTVFDHTSLIKTILRRFCQKPDGSIPNMGKRVEQANDLSGLLTEPQARDDTEASPTVAIAREFALATAAATEEITQPTELQEALLRLREYCLSQGVPEDAL